MQTATFTSGPYVVTIRSRTRKTVITEARYRQVLATAYPEVVEFEQQMYLVPFPKKPEDEKSEVAKERYEKAYGEYVNKMTALRARYPVGAAYSDVFARFILMLSRIFSIQGSEYHVDSFGTFTDAAVVAACESYLNEQAEEFWNALSTAIVKLDMPLTDVVVRPPEVLKEDEVNDPLSTVYEGTSNKQLKVEFSK